MRRATTTTCTLTEHALDPELSASYLRLGNIVRHLDALVIPGRVDQRAAHISKALG